MSEFNNCVHQINIGKRIAFLCDKAKLKQCQLAEACFVSPSTMSKYMSGNRKVPNEVLELIFDLFQISSKAFYRNDAFTIIARVVKNRTEINRLSK